MRIFRLTLVLMAGLIIGGCHNDKPLLTQPGAVEEIKPAETNALTGAITPAVTFTNSALKTSIVSGLRALDTGLSAAGIPWTHTATEGLLAAAGIVLGFTNRRNKQRLLEEQSDHKNTRTWLSTAEQVGQTLVDNLEKVRSTALTVPAYTADVDHKVMTAVQLAQLAAGPEVAGRIRDLVLDQTEKTIPAKT